MEKLAEFFEFQSTPSVGRATHLFFGSVQAKIFQSTPSMGRATHGCRLIRIVRGFQSTPSVGRATFDLSNPAVISPAISIHALRGEGDPDYVTRKEFEELFQSTPSVGRATKIRVGRGVPHSISIHALRGEGDP